MRLPPCRHCCPWQNQPPRCSQAAQQRRPIALQDIITWKSIGTTAVSNDGQWFAYRIAPGEGDAQVVVKRAKAGEKELTFEVGEIPTPAAGAGRGGDAGGGAASALDFSEDSKWVAFSTYPSRREAQRLRRQRRPVQSGVTIVNLATGEKREYPRIRRFAFSGDASTWIALQRQAACGQRVAAAPPPHRRRSPGLPDRPRGTDLILRELASGQELNVGNVADFTFSKDGSLLAWTIDAQDKVGNGLQLRDMSRGTVAVLDSGNASYERPAWTEKGDGLSVLKGSDDRALRDKRYVVLGFTGFGAGAPQKASYDPSSDKAFPAGMTISPNRDAAVDRGPAGADVRHPHSAAARSLDGCGGEADDNATPRDGDDAARPARRAGNRILTKRSISSCGTGSTSACSRSRKCRRPAIAPSATSRSTACSRRRSSASETKICGRSTSRRSRSSRSARTTASTSSLGNLDGRRFQDIYVIDMATGTRKLALKRARWYNGPSPDGKSFLYYEDGNYHVYSMESGQTRNITAAAPISFVDAEDDHNVIKPPAGTIGWAKDSASVLLSDNWDIWQIPVAGGAGGQPDRQRPQGSDSLPAPLSDRADRRARAGHRPREAAVLSPRTASGRRRPASRS